MVLFDEKQAADYDRWYEEGLGSTADKLEKETVMDLALSVTATEFLEDPGGAGGASLSDQSG